MGYAVKDGAIEKAPETPPPSRETPMPEFTTMGEHARYKAERAATPPAPTPDPAAAAPAATPAPTATPPAPEPPAKPKLQVEKGKPIEEIVEGVVKRLTKPAEPPAPAQPSKPAEPAGTPDPDAAYIEALTEEQRDEVELARYAAKAMPDKYGQMAKRTVDYLKKVDEFISTKQKEDPNWKPEEDEEFDDFIRENRPTYQPGDKRKLERSWIAADVTKEVESKFQPKIEQAERAARVHEIKPELEKATESYRQTVVQALAPDDKSPFHGVVAKAIEGGLTEEAWKEAKKVDPLVVNVTRPIVERAVAMGKTVLELVSGIGQQVPYNPALSPNHVQNMEALKQAQLFQFIDTQEQLFNQSGGNLKVANGKMFLPRREFYKLPEQEQAKHWTLTPTDILGMLADDAAIQAKTAVDREIAQRQEEGFTRNGHASVPKTETAPAPPPKTGDPSPKATVTPSPGAATPPATPQGPVLMPKEFLDRMFVPGRKEWAS